MPRAGDELAEELVVAGAVEHEGLHAVREEPREQDVDEERLAAAGARVDQQRAVVVRGVERVDQRDLAAGVGERERDPGRRAAAGADQRDGVADVAGDVLARQPRRRRGPSGSVDCQSSSWRSWPRFTRASEAAMISREACSTASASWTGSGSGPRSRIDW